MSAHVPCEGIGRRAVDPDPATRTGICPTCNGIRSVELSDEGNYVMDFHTVLLIGWADDGEEDTPNND